MAHSSSISCLCVRSGTLRIPLKILVCGGRNFADKAAVDSALAPYEGSVSLVITGNAPGADSMAEVWAAKRGIPLAIYPAHWRAFGKGAGPRRNAWMLEYAKPDLVIAFPGGTGTANCVEQARERGIRVLEVEV